jgi:hypothetical protein
MAAAAAPSPLMPRIAVALLITALAPTPLALAQDGVFVDPESPAGKEYAIPLEQARREAAGGGSGRGGEAGGGSSGATGQPLFGVGIERADGESRGRGGGAASANGHGRSNQRGERQGDTGKPGAGDIAPNARSSAAIEAGASEGSDTLLTGGIAAAVLGAGLLAGFGLRRLLRDS